MTNKTYSENKYSEDDLIMISALQHYVFCPRQCALIHIEQIWSESGLTAEGRIMHEKVHEEFANKLTAKMAGLKMGNGLDEGVMLGPLVNKDGRDKVIELVDDAVAKGAKVLSGGKTPDGPGFFYPATVITNVPDGAKMLNEEIFGPVASIQPFASEDEAIQRANATEYGLVAYLYTKDLARGLRVSE